MKIYRYRITRTESSVVVFKAATDEEARDKAIDIGHDVYMQDDYEIDIDSEDAEVDLIDSKEEEDEIDNG